MKTITKNTILKQGDNTFAAVEHDGNILWLKNEVEYHLEKLNWCGKPIVAQSKAILESIPVISLDSYVERLAKQTTNKYVNEREKQTSYLEFINGFKSNPNQYNKDDLVKAIEMARKFPYIKSGEVKYELSAKQILEQISSISFIEVDENFNVINFK